MLYMGKLNIYEPLFVTLGGDLSLPVNVHRWLRLDLMGGYRTVRMPFC